MLVLDSDEAECLLNITGAFGAHLRGLFLQGRRGARKPIHGVFLNNAEKCSPKEDAIVIDNCKIEKFSGHGVHLLRIWLFIKGDYTPHFGLLLRKLSHSVISSNTLFHGYMKDMTADLGEHGADYVFANNVGCPMT